MLAYKMKYSIKLKTVIMLLESILEHFRKKIINKWKLRETVIKNPIVRNNYLNKT